MISRILLLCAALAAPAAASTTVGFQHLTIPDGDNPPLELGIWYPAKGQAKPTHVGPFVQDLAAGAPVDGSALPLIVFSHGNGGEFAEHSDTELALAEAGFVVAAPTHTGDNFRDQSRATDPAARVRQLAAVVRYMERDWPAQAIDASRVGAFGFSSGGFTVLVAAGGDPDMRKISAHCAALPDFFDCQLMAAHPPPPAGAPKPFPHLAGLRAIAVAAPALGFTFDKAGLTAVTMNVQLWRASDDAVLPNPFYAEAVRAALPRPPEMHVVPHASHLDFLAPCSKTLAEHAQMICTSEPGFDSAAFHRDFNRQVVAFFRRSLQ